MNGDDFQITEEKNPEGIKFIIKGQLNSGSVNELEDKLQQALDDGQRDIVLNMLWVKFLSSAGIRVILKTYQETNKAGGNFRIEMPSENVKNVLGMTALDKMLIK